MIDLQTEPLSTLSQACTLLPKLNGKRPVPSTLWRWCRKGSRGILLEYVKIGSRIATSAQALTRFANRVAEAEQASADNLLSFRPKPRPKARSAARREREVAAAEARLRERGVLS